MLLKSQSILEVLFDKVLLDFWEYGDKNVKSARFWAQYNTNGSINVGHCCHLLFIRTRRLY